MANAPIRPVVDLQYSGNSNPVFREKRDSNAGANAFNAYTFVKLTSGFLAVNASTDVLTWGLTIQPSAASTDVPPAQVYYPYTSAWVLNPTGVLFVINITDGSGNIGSGTTTQGDVTVGTQYGLRVLTSGTYSGYSFLDAANTTNKFFQVEGYYSRTGYQGASTSLGTVYPDGDLSTDKNGRVIVSLLPAVII